MAINNPIQTDATDDNRADAVQTLVARAEENGYITARDLYEVLGEDAEDTIVEATLEELDELGVEVRNLDDDDDSKDKSAKADDDDGDSDEQLADIEAVSADDPVGLYFRQMAQEPLLTADEEIDLAKRIEMGKIARETLEEAENLTFDDRIQLAADIEQAQEAREHLGRANTRLVVSIAKRYMGLGLPFPDLIQEGN
ncbi:MAG: sigma-70 factor domain-containing protein, partial [Anaerolineae bacterium]